MEKRIRKEPYDIDPDKRPWEYDCQGNKVVKGDFTRLWQPEIQPDVSEVIVK